MKNIFILILFLSFAIALQAQPRLGLKAGVNLATQYANNDEIGQQSANFGYQGGLVIELPVTQKFSFQPELLYTRKGSHYDAYQTEVDGNLGYLELPVLAVFKPLLAGAIRFHIGPQFSYLTNVEYQFTNLLTSNETEIDTDRNNFEEWDIGAAVGTSLHFGNIYGELRLSQGFRSIEKPRQLAGIEFGNTDLKNFALQLSAGIMF